MANVYFGDVIGVESENWNTSIKFTVSGITVAPSVGDTYTNNGVTFKVTVANFDSINAGGTGTSTASGTLTRVSGTGDATIAFSAKADVNWFSSPGSLIDCESNLGGTPLGRLPTTADTVIIYNTISIGPDITPWPSAVVVGVIEYSNGTYIERRGGRLGAGTFNGAISVESLYETSGVIEGTTVCNGPVTCNGPIYLTGSAIFNGSVSFSQLSVTDNVTFNGTLINAAGTSTSQGGSLGTGFGDPIFNCAIPDNLASYSFSGGIFDRPLVLGLAAPTPGAGSACTIALLSGFSTSQNVTLNCKTQAASLVPIGSITINNCTFTGLLTINRDTQSQTISGSSYSPPAVTTPAVRSGNSMTLNFAAVPKDPGFVLGGGTFNPTVLLAGTSNEIIGAGLP